MQDKSFWTSRRCYTALLVAGVGVHVIFAIWGSVRGEGPVDTDRFGNFGDWFSGVGALVAVGVALRAIFDENERHGTTRMDALRQAAISRVIEQMLPARTSYANHVWNCLADPRLDELRRQLADQSESGKQLQLPADHAEIFEPMKAAGRALSEMARTLARLTAGLSEKSRRALADYADVVHGHTQHYDLRHARNVTMKNELRGTVSSTHSMTIYVASSYRADSNETDRSPFDSND